MKAKAAAPVVEEIVVTCEEWCAQCVAANGWDNRIITVYHPEPHADVFPTDNFGNLRVEQGELGYVLATGERKGAF